MRLLQLFEQLDRLDEAAVDRYMQMFEGISALLDEIATASPVEAAVVNTRAMYVSLFDEVRKILVAAHMAVQPGSNPAVMASEFGMWEPRELWDAVVNGVPDFGIALEDNVRADLMNKMRAASAKMAAAKQTEQTSPESKVSNNMKEMKATIEAQVKGAMETFTRADRITWYLRWYKIGLLFELTQEFKDNSALNKMYVKETAKMDNILAKYPKQVATNIQELEAKLEKVKQSTRDEESTDITILQDRISSLKSLISMGRDKIDKNILGKTGYNFTKGGGDNILWKLKEMDFANIPPMDNLRFDAQTLWGLLMELNSLGKEYKVRIARYVDPSEEDEHEQEVLIEFPDGMKWVNLNKRECEIEGRSGGQCGNVEWGRPSDLVWSLREPHNHPVTGTLGSISRATFIFDTNDNLIGEMKGYKNQKPSKKYHPYIVELFLQTPRIEGIKGGGHSPGDNFEVDDLNPELYTKLIDARPELADLMSDVSAGGPDFIRQQWEEYGVVTTEIIEAMETMWEEAGGSYTFPSHRSGYFDFDSDMEELSSHAGSALESAIRIMEGDEYADDPPYQPDPEEVWDTLDDSIKAGVNKWLIENHEDEVAELVAEWKRDSIDEIAYDDIWNFMEEYDIDDIKQAMYQGCIDGAIRGYESAIHVAVQDYLADLPNNTGHEIQYDTGSETIDVPEAWVVDMFMDEDSAAEISENGIVDAIGLHSFSMPDEFEIDWDAAKESAADALLGLGIS